MIPGININITLWDWIKLNLSLPQSFTASAKGWNKPKKPTFWGPTRNCLKDKTFRSNKVKKATLTRARPKVTSKYNILIKEVQKLQWIYIIRSNI